MDIQMQVQEIKNTGVSWDCQVIDGIVPMISDGEEDLQCAVLAGFLIRGTVPQLPSAGVPWTEYLTKRLSFGELDYYIRESLRNVEKDNYYPQYDIEEDKLTMSIGKLTQEEAYNEL